jgi:hypothetical protein
LCCKGLDLAPSLRRVRKGVGQSDFYVALRRYEAARKCENPRRRAVSERTQEQGPQGSRSEEGAIEDYSSSDTDTTTVENFKGPKGLLAPLLNLDILPSPQSDTTTLQSGDSGDYQGSEGGAQTQGRG